MRRGEGEGDCGDECRGSEGMLLDASGCMVGAGGRAFRPSSCWSSG